MNPLIGIVSDTSFIFLFNYFITLFGATFAYMFSIRRGFTGSETFLKRFFPGKTETFYFRLDFVLVTFCGSLIGTIFYAPGNPFQALAAGIGWVGAVNVLVGTQAQESSPRRDRSERGQPKVG